MANLQRKRITREVEQLATNPPPGVRLCPTSEFSLAEVTVELTGAENTLYANETFKVLFKFSENYPFDSPQVTFSGTHIPLHPHVYTNGHICLSILTTDWSPALSIEAVCLSLISMLSSCKSKQLPPDNAMYVTRASKNPKDTRWWYHDDNV